MHVHLKTLGCRLNEAELETWAREFQSAGIQIARSAAAADLIVLNSCAVTQEAVRKSRQLIRRIHRDNPRAKLVVSGCYATLNREEAAKALGVDLVVANADKSRLVELTRTTLNLQAMPAPATEPGEVSLFSRGRHRAFVKVQDGCRYRCTFCIVTVARGEEKSRPIGEIVDEINALHDQGVREAILTGIHLGGYGGDRNTDLKSLIEAVLADTDIPRLRLGSLEPWDLPESFFGLFQNPRLMPHLHLPLQSGSDSVLRRMARRCKTQEFTRLVEKARREVQEINITTDIIVGFPGETDREWSQSFDYIEKTGFGHVHIFSYSKRDGTKAAAMGDEVPERIKKARSTALHRLAQIMKQETFERYFGRTVPVLLEGRSRRGGGGGLMAFGYTPNYLRVGVSLPEGFDPENRIENIAIAGAVDNQLIGELLGG